MKLALAGIVTFALLLPAQAARGQERPFDFGLSGRVTITEATEWMDGGSVTVKLQDEHGHEARAGYRSGLRDYPGQCSFTVAPDRAPTIFLKGGVNEQALRKLLRDACVATYGTEDVEQLKTSKDWNRMATGDLLRRLDARAKSRAVDR